MKEKINIFKDLVQNVGFPIVACIALFWMLNSFKVELVGELKALNFNLNEVIKKVAIHEIRIEHLEGKRDVRQ